MDGLVSDYFSELARDENGLVNREDVLARILELPGREKYLNREISWLHFNMRVLEEAQNKSHPLLERVRFLSISGTNLDEFYMVRIAGLKGQKDLGIDIKSDDLRTPDEQLKLISTLAEQLILEQQKTWDELRRELGKNNIKIVDKNKIGKKEKAWAEQYFLENILPVLTPIAVDPAHPFPFIPNLGFTMAMTLSIPGKGGGPALKRVSLLPIPAHLTRFLKLPGNGTRYVYLEDILALCLPHMFPEYKITGFGLFRIVRDSDIEIEEEAEDLVRTYETALKRRRRGRVIRLKIDSAMPEDLRQSITHYLGAEDDSIIIINGMLGIDKVSELIADEFPELKFGKYEPRYPERLRDFGGDVFKAIAAKDFVVHHPYESFEVVHQFLLQAARDPKVVAIKQTLYRAGSQSEIISALIEAAERGKSVTAVVELKARFDEEQNIKWAREMERAGVHIVFGFIEKKTHAKISMVVRREGDGLKTYLHFGTGNYHPVTARIYTDLSYFTTDPALGRDAGRVFNYLTGYVPPKGMEKLIISPFNMRNKLIEEIENEIKFARADKPASIWVKLNSLLDPEIIDKLYEASLCGVQIDCIIRGICTLRPGIKGLSDTIRVKSIVGRFLEHGRICCFGNGKKLPSGDAKVYISSADWMPRNFDRRIESLIPIENPTVHKQILSQVMAANIKDTGQSWMMKSDGSYSKVMVVPDQYHFVAHQYFMTNPSLSGRGKALKHDKPVSHIINDDMV